MLQRHALVTSCMRVHAPCQAVDRPSCQNAADIAEQGGFPRPVICKVHMRPPRSEVETSSQSLASYPNILESSICNQSSLHGPSGLLERWLRFTSLGRHHVVSCPPSYSFLRFDWTPGALSVPALRPVVLLFDQRNAVRAPPGGQIRVTGDALRE